MARQAVALNESRQPLYATGYPLYWLLQALYCERQPLYRMAQALYPTA